MKLYARIKDNQNNTFERVVLCQFKTEEDEKVFVELVERHGENMFKVVVDEGYCNTEYFYPANRYSIVDLEEYE